MRKHLSIVLRLAVLAAGLAYIVWNVTWTPHVVFPAGTTLPSGLVLEKPMSYKVLSGDPEAPEVQGPGGQRVPREVTVEVHEPLRSNSNLVLGPEQFKSDASGYHYDPGVFRMLSRARVSYLLIAFVMAALIYPIQVVRWWLLLKVRGIDVRLWMAFKLTMIGCFFNYVMPGSTGGDVVKGYYAAKRKDKKADAVMTVVMDRVVGLFGLVALAGIAGLFMLKEPRARPVTLYVWLSIVGTAAASMVYFSKRLREKIGVQELLSKLPGRNFLLKFDESLVAYRDHFGVVALTLLMSMVVHLLLSGATALIGYALGMQASLGLLLTMVPLLFLASAVPLSYQGFGIMEGLAKPLLVDPPFTTFNQIVGMLLLIRLYQVIYSLVGGLMYLSSEVHMHPENEPDAESEEEPNEDAGQAPMVEQG